MRKSDEGMEAHRGVIRNFTRNFTLSLALQMKALGGWPPTERGDKQAELDKPRNRHEGGWGLTAEELEILEASPNGQRLSPLPFPSSSCPFDHFLSLCWPAPSEDEEIWLVCFLPRSQFLFIPTKMHPGCRRRKRPWRSRCGRARATDLRAVGTATAPGGVSLFRWGSTSASPFGSFVFLRKKVVCLLSRSFLSGLAFSDTYEETRGPREPSSAPAAACTSF